LEPSRPLSFSGTTAPGKGEGPPRRGAGAPPEGDAGESPAARITG
jgi:hypothetical protein